MSGVRLIFGEDDETPTRLLAHHLKINFREGRPPTFVEPHVRQFPTMTLLRAATAMAEVAVREARQHDLLNRMVIVGFDDPQSPPQFGTMLANLICFCVTQQTGREPGRVHVRRERDLRSDERERWVWRKHFFNGTTLRGAFAFYVADVFRAGGPLKHLIKSGIGKDYQGVSYDPRSTEDVLRAERLLGGVLCLSLWEEGAIIERELTKHVGFTPSIFTLAPGAVSGSTWSRRERMKSGEFRPFSDSDARRHE